MRYLPLFIDLRGAPVLIVGGGPIAARKLRLLQQAGARVTLVAPDLHEDTRSSGAEFEHRAEQFAAHHIGDHRLVIAATGDRDVNASIASAAGSRGILVNVVDDAELSSCIVPAIVDRSPVIVAISSGGVAPVLARRIRAQIEVLLDHTLGSLAVLLQRWRARIVAGIAAADARRRFYDDLLDGPVADAARAGGIEQAEKLLADSLQQARTTAQSGASPRGRVALVGAGPGDPGLLTLNALRALQRADVILYDRLVSAEVLALARRDARLLCVGKEAGADSTDQQDIHRLLLACARAGDYVVRLKGGDSLLFARGGEELQALHAAGIPFEVIPGITAAVAAGAYAGIPLTHRDHAQGLRLLTAQLGRGKQAPDWRAWARSSDTLAIYMALAQCATLSRELIRPGRDRATPVALVENASRPQQRVVLGRLDELAQLASTHELKSPTLVIVGAVAALGAELHWFGAAPLQGLAGEPVRAA